VVPSAGVLHRLRGGSPGLDQNTGLGIARFAILEWAACRRTQEEVTDLVVEGISERVRRFYDELWNQWRFDLVGELLAPELEFRGSLGATMRGHDGFIEYATCVRDGFPDFHNQIDELIVEESRAAARLTYTGTHEGEIFPGAREGVRIQYSGAAFFSFDRSTRITRAWVLGDLLSLLRQLGLNMLPD
jgi:predicted ester cyclase